TNWRTPYRARAASLRPCSLHDDRSLLQITPGPSRACLAVATRLRDCTGHRKRLIGIWTFHRTTDRHRGSKAGPLEMVIHPQGPAGRDSDALNLVVRAFRDPIVHVVESILRNPRERWCEQRRMNSLRSLRVHP